MLSHFTLFTQAERVGLLATVWLGAVGPEALLRSRLSTPARRWAARVVALVLLGVLAALSWHYLTTPARFIGGPTSNDSIG